MPSGLARRSFSEGGYRIVANIRPCQGRATGSIPVTRSDMIRISLKKEIFVIYAKLRLEGIEGYFKKVNCFTFLKIQVLRGGWSLCRRHVRSDGRERFPLPAQTKSPPIRMAFSF